MYKMRKDGTEKTKLDNGKCYRMSIIGDWIYYRRGRKDEENYEANECGFFRIRLDGTEKQRL
jgi:hypothetical protein